MYLETVEVANEGLDLLIVLKEGSFFCLEFVGDLALYQLGVGVASDFFSTHLPGELESGDECLIFGLVV